MLIAAILTAAPALADGERLAHNPFSRPPSSVVVSSNPENPGRNRAPEQAVDLRATMVVGERGLANVDGRILRPGDEVDGYRLERVYEDRAVFSRSGKPIIVYVKPQLVTNND
jgi:hypothetical protein